VRALAKPILQHRMITNFHAEAEGVRTPQLIDRLLQVIKP
jgi:MoxR-like ATPase